MDVGHGAGADFPFSTGVHRSDRRSRAQHSGNSFHHTPVWKTARLTDSDRHDSCHGNPARDRGTGNHLFLATLSQGLIWLKWFGVAYLLFLGSNSLYAFYTRKKVERSSASASMQRGFWVSLTNPKTILFFSAFLPQFASTSSAYHATDCDSICLLSLASSHYG